MAYEKDIKITKDGLEAVIKDASWPVYERNGWTRADDGGSEETAAEAVPEAAEAPAPTATRKKAD